MFDLDKAELQFENMKNILKKYMKKWLNEMYEMKDTKLKTR